MNSIMPRPSLERFLIFGEGGWIAGLLANLLRDQGKHVSTTAARMEDMQAVHKALDEHRPTRVINCAGKTGRPNVDWCEDNRAATVRSNVIGTLLLADICESRDIHCTVLATGCTISDSSITRSILTDCEQVCSRRNTRQTRRA